MRIVIGILLAIFCPFCHLSAQNSLEISTDSKVYELTPPLYFIEDPVDNLNIQDIAKLDSAGRFTAFPEKDLSFGFTKSSYWLKIQVKLKDIDNTDWLLIISNPYLPELSLYFKNHANKWDSYQTGASLPFVNRPVGHRLFVLPLVFKNSQSNTFYLKVNSRGEALNVPLSIQKSDRFYSESMRLEIGYGIFFGILFFVLFNNAFLYISLRERSYLLYVFYILFIGLTNAYISGHVFEYVFAYLPYSSLHFYTLPYFIFFTHIFGTLFSVEFLHTKEYLPRLYRFILILLIINVFAFVSYFISGQSSVLIVAHLIGVMLLMSAFISGFMVWRKGNIAARYYVVAYILLFGGSSLLILRNVGIFPDVYLSVHGLELGILAEAIMLSVALADKNGLQKKNAQKELEQKVVERTKEIAEANIEIAKQNGFIQAKNIALEKAFQSIEEKNKDITASITYAQRIQGAVLPNPEILKQTFPECFIYYRPRDIVSGDFYWFEKINTPGHEGCFVLALADCTGHGVPGAFMSMIGNALLNEIILEKDILQPDLVLNALHIEIQKALKQKEGNNQDGMDIALLLFDLKARKCFFAGAKSNLYYSKGAELLQINGDRFSIGGFRKEGSSFGLQELSLEEEMNIFLCTDGYQDQFGGTMNRKFGTQRLREFFTSLIPYNAEEQGQKVDQNLKEWMGLHPQAVQIDDISVIGLKINPLIIK